MKATGVVRKVDQLGRLVIPRELCNARGIGHGTPLEIFVDGESIILRKYKPICNMAEDLQAMINFLGTNDPELLSALESARKIAEKKAEEE